MPKSKLSKACQFSIKEKDAIKARDSERCIFCGSPYSLEVMHFVPKSSLGLGIKENGALGCKWCHTIMDNSLGEEQNFQSEYMKEQFKNYLDKLYPNFPNEERKYKKWNLSKK